jgi:hypothetical protein
LSLGAFILAPIVVIIVFAFAQVLWVALVSATFWLLATVTARTAVAGNRTDWRMPEYPAQPPSSHPYLIMNPRSGGGKVERFDLKRKAEDLGAEVFVMGGLEPVDVAQVARKAIAKSADLLGVAGGDGTQALVAEVAAEHGILNRECLDGAHAVHRFHQHGTLLRLRDDQLGPDPSDRRQEGRAPGIGCWITTRSGFDRGDSIALTLLSASYEWSGAFDSPQ